MSIPLAFRLRTYRENPIARRLSRGAGAGLYGRACTLISQLIAIPVLTSHWGPEGYGVWLMLTTVPFYLAMGDFGLGAAAQVDMMKQLAQDNEAGALKAFQSVWVFLSAIMGAVMLLTIVTCTWLYVAAPSGGGPWGTRVVAPAVALMMLYACGLVQMSLIYCVYRATDKYALGTMLFMTALPIEAAWLVGSVLLGGGVLVVLLGYVALRGLALLLYALLIAWREPWLRIGWRLADFATIRRMAKPSIAYLAYTLAVTLILQVLLLTLGAEFGPAVVAVFGASRFLARIPLQLYLLFDRASVPELTRGELEGKWGRWQRLVQFNLLIAVASSMLALVALFFFGSTVLDLISDGLTAKPVMFFFLSLATMFFVIWNALATPLFAGNHTSRYAYHYLGLALIVVLAPFAHELLPSSIDGATFAAAVQAGGEFVMLLVMLKVFPRFLRDNGTHWQWMLRP